MPEEIISQPELKPCPFCMGKAEHFENDDKYVWRPRGVRCAQPACLARPYVTAITEVDAAFRWNRRA